MIDLYLWTTPNGRKPLIMLEELGLPFNLKPVHLNGEQKAPEYVARNPNGRIPTLVDEPGTPEEVTIFESGAILVYLAEKTGRFLPAKGQPRATAMAWLMFQMAGVGPMFGQLGFFLRQDEKVPVAIDRYQKESERLLGVMDGQLAKTAYLAGEYGIADIATYPWVAALDFLKLDVASWPNVARWTAEIAARPAVKKAMDLKL